MAIMVVTYNFVPFDHAINHSKHLFNAHHDGVVLHVCGDQSVLQILVPAVNEGDDE